MRRITIPAIRRCLPSSPYAPVFKVRTPADVRLVKVLLLVITASEGEGAKRRSILIVIVWQRNQMRQLPSGEFPRNRTVQEDPFEQDYRGQQRDQVVSWDGARVTLFENNDKSWLSRGEKEEDDAAEVLR